MVLVSAFDPVRREVARQALQRLCSDGRIHPARIEEVVEKTTEEINAMVRDAGAGWVVDGDPQTFGARVSELCADPSLMREMGERGRLAARHQFSWDRVAERMESAYRTVLS